MAVFVTGAVIFDCTRSPGSLNMRDARLSPSLTILAAGLSLAGRRELAAAGGCSRMLAG